MIYLPLLSWYDFKAVYISEDGKWALQWTQITDYYPKNYFLSIINQDSFICRFRNIGLSRFSYHEFEPETPNKKIKQFEEGVRAVSVCRISALFRTWKSIKKFYALGRHFIALFKQKILNWIMNIYLLDFRSSVAKCLQYVFSID